jgi:hypothetical protein
MADHPTRPRLRLLLWLALAGVLALVILGPSAAGVAGATQLAQTTPISSDAVAFQGDEGECAGLDLDPGEVVWHFVLVQTSAPVAGSTLTATFANAGTVTVSATNKTGSTLHFFVSTGVDTLLGASTNVNGGRLNLSHICSGGTTTTTTTTATTTT